MIVILPASSLKVNARGMMEKTRLLQCSECLLEGLEKLSVRKAEAEKSLIGRGTGVCRLVEGHNERVLFCPDEWPLMSG